MEGRWMKTILKQALITPGNYSRIAARIVPQDQRDAIRPGIVVSHYPFTNSRDQRGYITISHTTKRAGICFAEEHTQWGRWDEETHTLTTDGGQRYTLAGQNVAKGRDPLREQEDRLQAGPEP
jgi:hypothetical protein